MADEEQRPLSSSQAVMRAIVGAAIGLLGSGMILLGVIDTVAANPGYAGQGVGRLVVGTLLLAVGVFLIVKAGRDWGGG